MPVIEKIKEEGKDRGPRLRYRNQRRLGQFYVTYVAKEKCGLRPGKQLPSSAIVFPRTPGERGRKNHTLPNSRSQKTPPLCSAAAWHIMSAAKVRRCCSCTAIRPRPTSGA